MVDDSRTESVQGFRGKRCMCWRCEFLQKPKNSGRQRFHSHSKETKSILKATGLENFYMLNFTPIGERRGWSPGDPKQWTELGGWVRQCLGVLYYSGRPWGATARPNKSIYCVSGINLTRSKFWTQLWGLCTECTWFGREYPPLRGSIWYNGLVTSLQGKNIIGPPMVKVFMVQP